MRFAMRCPVLTNGMRMPVRCLLLTQGMPLSGPLITADDLRDRYPETITDFAISLW